MSSVQFQLGFLFFLLEIVFASDWITYLGLPLTRVRSDESDRLNKICGFAPKREENRQHKKQLTVGHGEEAELGEFPWAAVLTR